MGKKIDIELIGPFRGNYYTLSVDGYSVPHLQITKLTGADDGLVEIVLDGRFGHTCLESELIEWGWFLFHTMAVSAGYTSGGEHCNVKNPFKVRLMGL